MKLTHYEIEFKYLVDIDSVNYRDFPFVSIEQAYISTNPVIRIRRFQDSYVLTIKGDGEVKHVEYELPLSLEQYQNLTFKAEGFLIQKKRYKIPYLFMGKEYTIELDIFEGDFEGLVLAEVEFSSEKEALAFIPPKWFLENVSYKKEYHNSYLSQHGLTDSHFLLKK